MVLALETESPAPATADAPDAVWAGAVRLFLHTPDGIMSFASLTAAFLIAAGWFWMASARKGRRMTLRRLVGRVLPWRYLKDRSHRLDLWFLLINSKVLVVVAAWMVLSSHQVGLWTHGALVDAFGPPGDRDLPLPAILMISTIGLYLAYEFGYWLDHYLCHRIPWLWELHRVHHEATVMSPVTTHRVHPVESVMFANVLALVTGPVQGLLAYGLGQPASEMTLLGYNAILLVLAFLVVQLQHSHVWIPITGWLGRIILSPAHHQIHHSADPAHYGRNLGSCLAVFDWMFGTLIVPERERQKLVFGVPDETGADPHTLQHGLLAPFRRILNDRTRFTRPRRAGPAAGLAQARPG